jgi:hypothetical protein
LRKINNKSPDVGAGAKSIPIIRGSLGVGIGNLVPLMARIWGY